MRADQQMRSVFPCELVCRSGGDNSWETRSWPKRGIVAPRLTATEVVAIELAVALHIKNLSVGGIEDEVPKRTGAGKKSSER